jgi:hypothetical protein
MVLHVLLNLVDGSTRIVNIELKFYSTYTFCSLDFKKRTTSTVVINWTIYLRIYRNLYLFWFNKVFHVVVVVSMTFYLATNACHFRTHLYTSLLNKNKNKA